MQSQMTFTERLDYEDSQDSLRREQEAHRDHCLLVAHLKKLAYVMWRAAEAAVPITHVRYMGEDVSVDDVRRQMAGLFR